VSARDARTGPARDRASAKGRRQSAPTRAGGTRATARPSTRRGAAGRGADIAVPGDGLVVGAVPVSARVAGALLVLAGVAGAAGLLPTYLIVGGAELTQASGVGSVLVGLLVPLAHIAVGVVLLCGAVPKFGLAYAGVAAALTLGLLLIELYRGSSSTSRPGIEVLAGSRVVTSGVEIGAGWVLTVVALGLTVLAGILAVVAWGRTVMEDGGALDPVRSGLAGAAVLLGVTTVLSLTLPAADVPDEIVTDPVTGMQTVVTQEGPQALLERPGLALMGGLLLAGAVVLCSVIAPSLRPRLAAVGGLLALAVLVLAAGLTGLRDAASPALEWTVPGAGLVLAGVGYAVLTALAWRLRRGVPLR
jgi:iron complex transport system permease protein